MNLLRSKVFWLTTIVICHSGLLAGSTATAEVLEPIVSASIRDEQLDGIGDLIDPFPHPGVLLLVPDRNLENRAIVEFNLTGVDPALLESADLAFTLYYNNSIEPTNRQFNVSIYSGNGTVELTDFEIPATILGQFHLTLDIAPATYSNESILSLVQTILSEGTDFIGVRFEPVGGLNPASIVQDVTLTLRSVPEPSAFLLAALGGLAVTVCRRRIAGLHGKSK